MKLEYKKLFSFVLLLSFLLLLLYVIYVIYPRDGFEGKNYLDGVDAIYWINLDRSPERHDNMQTLLSNKPFDDIPNYRISATDGKIPNTINKKLGIYTKQDDITDYEYACLISHLNAIQEFSNSNYNIALILEDDVTLEFQKYWKKSISEIINSAPSDWGIITLYYTIQNGKFVDNEFEKHSYVYTGALAYIINKKAANIFITSQMENGKYNLGNHARHISDWYIYHSINTYIYRYPMFIYKTENDSTIHETHLSEHVQTKIQMINAYENEYPNRE